jgi:hypothetical protein
MWKSGVKTFLSAWVLKSECTFFASPANRITWEQKVEMLATPQGDQFLQTSHFVQYIAINKLAKLAGH